MSGRVSSLLAGLWWLCAGVCADGPGGPPGGWVISIVPAVDNPDTLYAAFHGGGIYKSADGGVSWSALNHGLGERTVIPILTDFSNPRVLYAGTEVGLFKTTDGGASWFASDKGLTNRNVWSLAMDPADSRRIYAGTSGGGLFRSDDAGRSWRHASDGLRHPAVWPVLVLRTNPEVVHVGTLGGGVFRSANRGGTWLERNDGLDNRRVFSLAADEAAGILYAGTAEGVVEAPLSGGPWQSKAQGLPRQPVFALTIVGSGERATFYAATGGGVFRAGPGGRTWTRLSGSYNPIVWAVAADPRSPARLVIGTLGGGLFRSRDGGETWSPAAPGLQHHIVFSLAHDGRRLFAGTVGAGVFRSADNARTWSPVNAGLSKPVIKALALDPSTPGVLYAGAEEQFMAGQGGIFKSEDAGGSWREVSRGFLTRRVFSLALHPRDPRRVFAGTDGGEVYASADAGASWSEITGGQIVQRASEVSAYQQAIHARAVFSLALDPQEPQTIYAGTDAGAFRTTDSGKSWTDISATLADRRVRVLLWHAPTATLFAGCGDLGEGGGLYKSTDRGRTWTGAGIANQWVLALAADPGSPDILYAGTEQGLFRSADRGRSWAPVQAGPFQRYVLTVAVNPADRSQVFGGTEGNGLFAGAPLAGAR